MIQAYCKLHQLGVAHSVETWQDGKLVGGTYGLAIGGFFAAESMFHSVSEASKAAIVHLVRYLRSRQFSLLDIQQSTPHMVRMGAIQLSREKYLARLECAVQTRVRFSPA